MSHQTKTSPPASGWNPLALFGRGNKKQPEARHTQSYPRRASLPIEWTQQPHPIKKDELPRRLSFGPLSSSIQSSEEEGGTLDESSVISEVTQMTYTTERAHEIKDKFIHRIKQHYSTKTSRDLSAHERSEILHDILYEQQNEWRMKRECEMQKRCRQNEVFELFKP